MLSARRDPRRAGQGRAIDQKLRFLAIALGQGVGQDQAALGVGIADLDRATVAGGEHVAGTEGIAGNRVVDGRNEHPETKADPLPEVFYTVQIALLLDTSSSMDGLINQARSQVWKMVNELGRGPNDGRNPVEKAFGEPGTPGVPIVDVERRPSEMGVLQPFGHTEIAGCTEQKDRSHILDQRTDVGDDLLLHLYR